MEDSANGNDVNEDDSDAVHVSESEEDPEILSDEEVWSVLRDLGHLCVTLSRYI